MRYLTTLFISDIIYMVGDRWISECEALVECCWHGKFKFSETICSIFILSTSRFTWCLLGLNPELHGERQAAACL
jgi:hypothetical protein